MCGIYAYSSIPTNGFSNDELNLLFSLSWITQLRGKDSSGVCLLGNDYSSQTFKVVGGPELLLNKTDWDANIRPFLFKKGLALFGHGRAATRGSVNVKNAHPFTVDRADKTYITLVHNGTLEYDQPFDGLNKHDVDSAWLAEVIAKEGAKEVLPRVNGALALIWYDSADNTMNLFRNLMRPLSIAVSPEGAFYVASESSFLAFAKQRHDLKFEFKDILELNPMTHVKIDMATVRDIKEIDDVPAEEYQRVIVPAKVVRYERPTGGMPGYHIPTQLPLVPAQPASEVSFVPYSVTDKDNRIDSDIRDALSHRSYDADAIRLHLQDMKQVEWTEVGDRQTTFHLVGNPNGGSYKITHAGSNPYRLGLVKMFMTDKGSLVLEYKDVPENRLVFLEKPVLEGMLTDFITRVKKHKWSAITAEPKQVETKVVPINSKKPLVGTQYQVAQKMKPNASVKFHSKSLGAGGTITVKHKAKRTPAKDQHSFVDYENDQDGKFKLGDTIMVEVDRASYVKNKDGDTKTVLVKACKATSKMDSCIDYQFYVTNLSPEEVTEFGLFECRIASMRLATKQEYLQTGAIIIILLGSPIPATWIQGGKVNGTRH